MENMHADATNHPMSLIFIKNIITEVIYYICYLFLVAIVQVTFKSKWEWRPRRPENNASLPEILPQVEKVHLEDLFFSDC